MRYLCLVLLTLISTFTPCRTLAADIPIDLIAIHGGPIPSRGLLNDPNNVQLQVNLPGSTPAGPFVARYLNFEVSLGNLFGQSWAREAQIMVTPPSGASFFVQPFSANGPPELGFNNVRFAIGVPIDPFTTQGTWTFRFLEIYDDVPSSPTSTGDDAIWTQMQVRASDTFQIYGFSVNNPLAAQGSFTNLPSGGTPASPLTTVTWTNTRPGHYPRVGIYGRATVAGVPLANSELSLPINLRVGITPPNSTTRSIFGPFPTGTTSSVADQSSYLFNRLLTYNGAGLGTWTFQFFPAVDLADVPIEHYWNQFAIVLLGVPDDLRTDLGTIEAGSSQVIEHTFTNNPLRFYRFTLTQDHSVNNSLGLQIFMPQDPFGWPTGALALYQFGGRLVARATAVAEFPPELPRGLSFGWPTINQTPYQSFVFDGRHGDLPAGTYFLAAAESDEFGENFIYNNSFPQNLPTTSIIIRSGVDPPQVTPGAQLTLGGQMPQNAEAVSTFTPASPLPQVWFKLVTNNNASTETGFFIDFDVANTLYPALHQPAPASFGIYSERGRLVGTGISTDPFAPSPWGYASFGAPSDPQRPPVPLLPGLPEETFVYPRNGSSGSLPGGTYYIAVTPTSNALFLDHFTAGTGPAARIRLNVRSNMQLLASPSPCGAADVGTEGGAAGSDSLLDNNDFIVFIDWFFQNDPLADLGSEGGASGPDQLFDNNDFIVFIDLFFSGSVSPGCNATP